MAVALRARVVLIAAACAACSPTPAPLPSEEARELDDLESYMIAVWACDPFQYFPPSGISARDLFAVSFGLDVPSVDYDLPYVNNPAARACVRATHGDCGAIMACLGFATSPTPVASCDAVVWTCDGDVAVFCADFLDSPQMLRQDCAALGLACGGGRCGSACASEGEACIAPNRDVRCAAGVAWSDTTCPAGTECASLACIDGGACPSVACVPLGPACTHDFCDGDVLVSCSRDPDPTQRRGMARLDCASAGMHCGAAVPPDGSVDFVEHAVCLPSFGECDPEAAATTCEGDVLTFCAPSGRVQRYDCVAHGFAGCGQNVAVVQCRSATPWPPP